MSCVVDYRVYRVPPRWTFLRLETDTGLVGWGECTLEGQMATVECEVTRLLEDHLLGAPAGEVTRHWHRMFRTPHNRCGPVLTSAIGGIDQALWDLKGKEFGAPVYELLGGSVRDRVPVYSVLPVDPADENRNQTIRDNLEGIISKGITAVKAAPMNDIRGHIETKAAFDDVVGVAEAIRSIGGADLNVALDFHGRPTLAQWQRLAARVDRFDPMFVEEPVLPEHLPLLNADRVEAPIAAGERLFTLAGFREAFRHGSLDVAQPDPIHAGGITGCLQIAELSGAYDAPVVPNCSNGPVATAAAYNVLMAAETGTMLPHRDDQGAEYVENAPDFTAEDGFLDPTPRAGLGIAVDESVVQRRSERNTEWRPVEKERTDGTPI